jgi:CRISPR-associated protein Csx14
MNNAVSSISVPVDLSNPGQFFACCGLFELADRLWRSEEVHAHFESQRFHLTGRDSTRTIASLLSQFAKTECEQLDPEDNAASPLRLLSPFDLRLDWWVKSEKNQVDLGGGGQLKTWAGKQFGPLIFGLMKKAAEGAALAASPLDYGTSVFDGRDGKANRKTVSPFYFDSRREGTCLDLGFSPDEQDMSVESFPAVESLALVGLQRFRPFVDDTTSPKSFVYTPWAEPLPTVVAGAAACGLVTVGSCGTFRFTKPSRGGEYMTMFSRATRERSNHV